jgi:hypothetical protein
LKNGTIGKAADFDPVGRAWDRNFRIGVQTPHEAIIRIQEKTSGEQSRNALSSIVESLLSGSNTMFESLLQAKNKTWRGCRLTKEFGLTAATNSQKTDTR